MSTRSISSNASGQARRRGARPALGVLGVAILSAAALTALAGALPLHAGQQAAGVLSTLKVTKLTLPTGGSAPGGNSVATFGNAVAVSADGRTALIGGDSYNVNGPVGAAWVYTRSAKGVWSQQAVLRGKGESGNGLFGFSVSLSANGNTALVGAKYDNAEIGAAWVFVRHGTTWTQQGPKLTGAGEVGASYFGWSVALSGDGNTAMIGAPIDNTGTPNSTAGAVWAFGRSASGVWTPEGSKIVPTDESYDGSNAYSNFGYSISLSTNGRVALIGGWNDGTGSPNSHGAAWIYARSGSSWTESAKLVPTDWTLSPIGSHFGNSVSLSGAGTTALIGASFDNNGVGAAWVFKGSGKTWAQQGGKLTGRGEVGQGQFGGWVALSSDARTAMVGSWMDASNIGAAYVFTPSGTTWKLQGTKKLTGKGEVSSANFGYAVALSANGSTALIGGPNDNGNQGAVWIYG